MVVKRGELLVPLDRNPLELFLLGLCVTSGVANGYGLALGVPPGDHVPAWMAWFFAGLITYGGVAGIAGAFWKDAITGVLIVRAAMIPTCTGSLSYAVAVFGGGGGLLASVVVAGFAVACGWRAWDITKHVKDRNRTRILRGTQVGGGAP